MEKWTSICISILGVALIVGVCFWVDSVNVTARVAFENGLMRQSNSQYGWIKQ